MINRLSIKVAFRLYNIGWNIFIPFLRLNKRIAEGFKQRILAEKLPKADIWIQAASVGESFLAKELISHFKPSIPTRILLTSNTSQGIEILKKSVSEITPNLRGIIAFTAYFPFDKPAIMAQAVNDVGPKIMLLLESEMWPAHLAALKKKGCKILIINGRITSKSLSRYLIWPSLWSTLSPDKILAISKNDANRFATLFGEDRVDVMPNIKFDRTGNAGSLTSIKNPLEEIIPLETPFVVLGSIRSEEEPLVEKIVSDILHRYPEIIVGLFPRHKQRLKHWEKALNRMSVPWVLRSRTKQLVSHGTVILWDTFGELSHAYEMSKAAFVGGSLAPLGGQNFLEAIMCGVIPVIGPSWENFAWVGSEIIHQGLVIVAADWEEVTNALSRGIINPSSHETIRKSAFAYLKGRQGGTEIACRLIHQFQDNL
ncbi:MAG: 3-deoxy-D-manno-octulosonic acid transferase [Deltaproteobacteria bacterium]|nr:3-deoxy-D-manno-octulosonic acid transferase [Deltaproteobacteria bacterium]